MTTTTAPCGHDLCAPHGGTCLTDGRQYAPPTALPARYAVLNGTKGRYLDDGSNFVQWLADGDDPVVLAHADLARKKARMDAYVAAMREGRGGAHAGCDHAYGICSG